MKKIALIYTAVSASGDWSTGKAHEEVMPPLWALALATYLREALPSVKVEILDEQILGADRLLKKISSEKYDMAGFSPVAHTYTRVLECARLVKKKGAMVVLGGHYAAPLKREVFANRGPGSADHCVDAIVRYDGEKAFYELAKGTAFQSIKNLIYPGPGGEILENPAENLDLAALPPADYGLVNLEDYFSLQADNPAHLGRTLPFAAQRGCKWAQGPGRCFFCSIQSLGGVRAIPPEAAARRLASLARKFGVGHIYESSDDFPSDAAWFRQFSACASTLKLPALKVFARASALNPANIALMKPASVRYLNLGLESMSDSLLRASGKGSSVAVNRRAVSLLLEAGLFPNINLILGLPGETRATLTETFSEVKTMDLPAESCRRVSINALAVFPGTEAWRRLLEKEPKYRGADIFEYMESFRDWVKHFCGATEADIIAAKETMERYFTARRLQLEKLK